MVKKLSVNAGDTGSIIDQADLTGCGAAKPMHQNYWTCALEPRRHNYWALMPQPLKPMNPRAHAPQQKKPLQWEAHTLQLESSPNLPQLEKVLIAMKTCHNQK